jgi:hypothetical protein
MFKHKLLIMQNLQKFGAHYAINYEVKNHSFNKFMKIEKYYLLTGLNYALKFRIL